MGRHQCRSKYNNIKNKTSPESTPPPTSRPEHCNVDKAEKNDLESSLMKMFEKALKGKMKNAAKEIEEKTNNILEEINKEIEKQTKNEEINKEIEEKTNKKFEEMNKVIEEKNKKLEEMTKETEEKLNRKHDPSFCCIEVTHPNFKDRHYLRVKGWEKTFQSNALKKHAGEAILISNKLDFKLKSIKRD
ncbi:hypothetical protein STEG23_007931 [Scotinomys teguina]